MKQSSAIQPSYEFYEKTRWLYKFVDEKKMPTLIRSYLTKEEEFLIKTTPPHSSVIDFGCGFGRHLRLLSAQVRLGAGIDKDRISIAQSKEYLTRERRNIVTFVEEVTQTKFPSQTFDFAICMMNTFGNLYEKKIVALKEMKRVIKPNGKIIISVHAARAISAKIEWYTNTGFTGIQVEKNLIYTAQGFISEHFSKKQLQKLFIKAGLSGSISHLTPISYICVLSRI